MADVHHDERPEPGELGLMTAYSFGNRWVGIVALKEPPVFVPLHVMAARMAKARRSQRVQVGTTDLDSGIVLRALKQVRHGYALREQWNMARASGQVAAQLSRGRLTAVPAWLEADMLAVLRNRTKRSKRERSRPPTTAPMPRTMRTTGESPAGVAAVRQRELGRAKSLVASGWADALPPAPPHELATEPHGKLDELLALCGADSASAEGSGWLSWAVCHMSYLNELADRERTISAPGIKLLGSVGHQWVLVSATEKARSVTGDYTSAAQVSQARATSYAQIRKALGQAVRELGLAHLGKGIQTGGVAPAGVFEDVGFQAIGALCLALGSNSPANSVVEALWPHEATDTTDWQEFVRKQVGAEPRYGVDESGPAHDRTYTVTIIVPDGRSVTAGAASVKKARVAAAKAFAKRYLPRSASSGVPPGGGRPAQVLVGSTPHARTAARLVTAFDLASDSSPLVSQALVHPSWSHENRRLIAERGQRDYRVLAAEGSEVVRALAIHQHALTTLKQSLTPTADDARVPSVEGDALADLATAVDLADGLLLGKGTVLRPSIAADAAQGLIGAVWRARPGDLVVRQPTTLNRWLHRFRPDLDPQTLLERRLSSVGIEFEIEHDARGPEHRSEYCAVYLVGPDRVPWSGTWASSKGKARQSAAAELVDLMIAHADGAELDLHPTEAAVLRVLLKGDIRHVTARGPKIDRDVASRVLGVDALASGYLHEYDAWARRYEQVLQASGSVGLEDDLSSDLLKYYTDLLRTSRSKSLSSFASRALQDAFPADGTAADTGGLAGIELLRTILVQDSFDPVPLDQVVFTWLQRAGVRYSLDASEAPTTKRPLAAGLSAVLHGVLDLLAQLVDDDAPLELTWSAESDQRDALTIRARGIDLGVTVTRALHAVVALLPGFVFHTEGDSLRLICPVVPSATGPLAAIGLQAAEDAFDGHWLAIEAERIEAAMARSERVGEVPVPAPEETLEAVRQPVDSDSSKGMA